MSEIRVRIAPSPTGMPHIGTAYIALFNACFAQSQGGKFLLRIEDTDQSRSRREHEDTILEALRWAGLTWDEGPDVGGDYGPYRQSERTEIYREHVNMLVQKGHAYPCFCTPERLEALRKEQKEAGGHYGYDGHCSHLSSDEAQAYRDQGLAFTIRLRVPQEGTCTVQDPLRGEVNFDYKLIDHQILLKSDGFPTYHLANVVDDHLMKISHVIRGEEWLSSLPKHLLLYEYFGWEAPQVYHLPLLHNADGSKLSKRKNPTSILYYKEMGFLPQALLNFLGLMAYSLPNGQEVFALEDMINGFDINRISLGGPKFDSQKLTWLNQQHIAGLKEDQLLDTLIGWRFNKAYLRTLLPLMDGRLHTLGDFMKHCDFMFMSEVAYESQLLLPKNKESDDCRDFLQKLSWALEPLLRFEHDDVEGVFQKMAKVHGWSIREATHAARVAICGKAVAPPLYRVMEILGSDLCRNRIVDAVNLLGPLGKKKLGKLQKSFERDWALAEQEASN